MPEGANASGDTPPFARDALEQGRRRHARLHEQHHRTASDTAESAVLIRNLLLAQHDGNAAIVLAGPATGLVRILDLYRSRSADHGEGPRSSSWRSGTFPSGAPDASIKADVAAAKRLFAEWPTPIVAVGSEVGDALPYPGASIEKDFAWSPAHPVVDAYRAFKAMPYDAPAPALAAVLHAAHPDDGLLHALRARDDQRARRRPDAVHAGRRRESIGI